MWTENEEKGFRLLKRRISTAKVLKLFCPEEQITFSVDASQYALEIVIIQEGRPVAFSHQQV